MIPNTVKTIDSYAFYKCSELEELTLGSKVRSIGFNAFQYCNELKTITSRNEEAPVMGSDNCFSVYQTAKLYIPIGSKNSYDSTNYWNKFTTVIEKKMDNSGAPVVGDVTGDGVVNISDINFIINIILKN